MESKKILICGAGSIGIFTGVKLDNRGHSVELFGRRKLREAGDEKIIINNKEFKVPPRIFRIPKKEKYDFVFITTKLYDLDSMIKKIKNNSVKGNIFSGIQNGLVDTSKYTPILKKRIIPVVVFSGFNITKNKINVIPTPTGWKTEPSERGKKISKLLLDSGIPCTSDKRFDSLRAEKTIVNCCLNALSAIENKPFSYLFKNNQIRKRIDNLFEECYKVLEKEYDLDDAGRIRKRMHNHWAKLNHHSSTCQDINSNRPVETKYFNGYIVELGKKHNLPINHNKKILEDIEKRVKRR